MLRPLGDMYPLLLGLPVLTRSSNPHVLVLVEEPDPEPLTQPAVPAPQAASLEEPQRVEMQEIVWEDSAPSSMRSCRYCSAEMNPVFAQ